MTKNDFDSSKYTVLIIDDEIINYKVLRDLLHKHNYNVISATSGAEGRRKARKIIPDIILLDIMMPGENGFETCQKLRDNPVTADIPIIFLSALDDVDSIVKGLEMGGWDYITKPFKKPEVLARIKNYLKLSYYYNRIIEEQSKRLSQIQEAQQSILVEPEEIPRAKFGVEYVPVLEAGGDFYDVYSTGEGMFNYFIADVSGHNLEASFATSALKALVKQNSTQLATIEETMQMVNEILYSILEQGQHLTGILAKLTRRTKKLYIMNAAHLPVIIISNNGQHKTVDSNSDVIGVFKNAEFNTDQVKVEEGEKIYFYSDGLVELFQQKQISREEGIEHLIELCKKYHHYDISNSVKNIKKELFTNNITPEDDLLLLGFEI